MPYSDLEARKGGFIPWPFVVAVLIIVGMYWFAIWAATVAGAHSWYDPACCSTIDCHEADERVTDVPGGMQVKGWGFVRSDDPRVRTSRDGMAHVCESATKLLCVYRRPGGV